MPSPLFPQLLIRVLCDTQPPAVTDGAYLFGQTTDNEESVFAAAGQLLTAMLTRRVLLAHTEPMSGYPGFKAWQQALHRQGIGNLQIEGVTGISSPMLHTLIEAEALVRFAKAQGYRSLYVVAPPFHQPRAFMTAVTAALRVYPDLQLYSYPGAALPWQAEVAHSQGQARGTRSELVAGELERIRTYHEKGDLASVETVLDYLNKRL
jgi:uncharacterized SAM-binding protein YcdF (DUF218 family)